MSAPYIPSLHQYPPMMLNTPPPTSQLDQCSTGIALSLVKSGNGDVRTRSYDSTSSDTTEGDEPPSKQRKVNSGRRLDVFSQKCFGDVIMNEMMGKRDDGCNKSKRNCRGKNNKTKRTSKSEQKSLSLEALGKVDKLRQDILEKVFLKRQMDVQPGRVLKLSANDGEAKVTRFNKICPSHDVLPCIQERHGEEKGGMKLCIDKCSNCPSHLLQLDTNTQEWHRINGENTIGMSETLNEYLSLYGSKTVQGQSNDVVKYSDLLLDVLIGNDRLNQCIVKKRCNVKAIKTEYFNKIRTATPKKPTQPLNLSYPRFWIEIEKNCVYLSIVDTEAWKKFNKNKFRKWPVKSSIGAYVDGSMKIELAITPSFQNTQVVFEWFIRKKYMFRYLPHGINTIELRLKGNQERNDWVWRNEITEYFNGTQKNLRSHSMKCGFDDLCLNKYNRFNNITIDNKFSTSKKSPTPNQVSFMNDKMVLHTPTDKVGSKEICEAISTPNLKSPSPSAEASFETNNTLSLKFGGSGSGNQPQAKKAVDLLDMGCGNFVNRDTHGKKRKRKEMESQMMDFSLTPPMEKCYGFYTADGIVVYEKLWDEESKLLNEQSLETDPIYFSL